MSELESYKAPIAKAFAVAHKAVEAESLRMKSELRRINYVTASHFLGLVQGYRNILREKRKSLMGEIKKLRNGVDKLDEASEQVAEMSKELEVKQEVVSQSQKDCEELLVVIVSERRQTDEQKKQVEVCCSCSGVPSDE